MPRDWSYLPKDLGFMHLRNLREYDRFLARANPIWATDHICRAWAAMGPAKVEFYLA